MARKCLLYVCFASHPGNFLPSDGIQEFVARLRGETITRDCPVCGAEMRVATEQDELILVTPAMVEAAADVIQTFDGEKTQPLVLEDAG